MTTGKSTVTDWLRLVQAEYLEMPGLQLTRPQIRRLWGLEDATCDALLSQLTADGFLRRTTHDAYVLDVAAC
jgi:DNA-binding IclR family transcriptional regulator